MSDDVDNFDVLVIGSGAAGLGVALSLAQRYRVAVFCKDDLLVSASQYAQGGIAAVMDPDQDSYQSHVDDTLNAGAGLCDPTIVQHTVTHAKSAIEWLMAQGVQFTMDQGHYHLTQEGGHSHRRIIHVADKTGEAVVTTLAAQVHAHPRIRSVVQHTAIDLIVQNGRCYGAYFINNHSLERRCVTASFTVLATGGASMAYQHTTHVSHTTGDGIVMAYRAGAQIANMEFNQFHPTCFYNPGGNTFLISEVLRGEGGHLILPDGTRFMSHYDPRKELAPRDIVSRAIDNEMKKNHLTHVYLDIRHEPADKIKKLFPTIDRLCQQQGIDITTDPIPVVPAAHYTCGGVVTNVHGETHIPGLLAVGEVACTGLHGANRMASNSLLECVVFAKNAAERIQSQLEQPVNIPIIARIHELSSNLVEHNASISTLTTRLRQVVWDYLGIVRSDRFFAEARNALDDIQHSFLAIHPAAAIHPMAIELRNLIIVADLIWTAAAHRTESRGVHYHSDHPDTKTTAHNSLIHIDRGAMKVTYATTLWPHSLRD